MADFFERAADMNGTGLLLALALAVAPAGFAGAADPGAPATGAQVLSGGVGEGARSRLAEAARGYNLKLVFTLSTGSFISDVPFKIVRGNTTIVEDTARGPWAFVRLPPGSYAVQATYEGLTQTRKVSVAKGGQRTLPFSWPAPARIRQQPQ